MLQRRCRGKGENQRAPLPPFRLRHHAGKLTGNVGELRQLAQVFLPGRGCSLSDSRLGDVIENKRLPGEFFHQLHRYFEVPGEEQKIVGQVEIKQLGDAAAKLRLQHKVVVRFVVYYVADAHELWMLGKSLQLLG